MGAKTHGAGECVRLNGEQGLWSWWQAPLDRSPRLLRWTAAALLTLGTVMGSIVAERSAGDPFQAPDAAYYLRMAQGRMTEVQQPFASRPLAPLAARMLARAAHVRLETGFAALGVVSLVFLLGAVFALVTDAGAPRWFAAAAAVLAFWPQLWQGYPMPDLPYAALVGGLLLLLRARWYTAAALWMLPLTLARESTFLLLLCLLLVGWRELRPLRSGLAVAAVVAGSVAVKHLTAGAAGNQEHLPAALYLAGKVPWNLLRTFGVVPWSNLYPYLCAPPAWRFHVALGAVREVGVCQISSLIPVWVAMAFFTTFGLLPLALAITLRRLSKLSKGQGGWAGTLSRLSLVARFSLLYGGVSFVLALALGTAYARLFGYAWPLFLVALPALLALTREARPASAPLRPGTAWRLGSAWLPVVLGATHAVLLYLGLRFWGARNLWVEGGLWALAATAWSACARGARRPASETDPARG